MTRLIDKLLRLLGVADIPHVRKLFVGVVGMTVLITGLALLVLPGPAFLVIPLGLAVLATEFVWARRWLDKALPRFHKSKSKFAKEPKSFRSAGGSYAARITACRPALIFSASFSCSAFASASVKVRSLLRYVNA